MDMCSNPQCGKRLIPVRLPSGSWSDRHPTPQCDPDGLLDASNFPEPPKLEPAPQEANLE